MVHGLLMALRETRLQDWCRILISAFIYPVVKKKGSNLRLALAPAWSCNVMGFGMGDGMGDILNFTTVIC